MSYTLDMNFRSLALRVCCAFSLLASLPTTARADVKLAGLFADHMVLQRNTRVSLWGSAQPGELIRVRPSWYENDAAVTAAPDGSFQVSISTPEASGPHTIHLRGHNEVVLRDVLIGEVWLASGQSNMEMSVGFLNKGYSGVENWEQELADAARPRIRFFSVENRCASAPVRDVNGTWLVADAASVHNFSASAWFFAKRLELELDVPIGVVAADWGGTPAEAWTSAGALARFPRFTASLQECALMNRDQVEYARRQQAASAAFAEALASSEALSLANAMGAKFDDSTWELHDVPGPWTGELARFDGVVWMRRSVDIPAAWAGRELELALGLIDDDDTTWWNGQQVGATQGWNSPRLYKLPAQSVRAGRSNIAVRILDTSSHGGFRGTKESMALRRVDNGEQIALSGPWRLARGSAIADLPPYPGRFELGSVTPAALYNGMIAPLGRSSFAGVIWYQGESNTSNAAEYVELFPALIQDWRGHFGRELPFLFVQIAPHAYRGDNGSVAALREAQRAALALPGTGMVVTLDIGDSRDIHPKQKQAVGSRLAAFALRDVYGRSDVPCEAPSPIAVHREGSSVTIEFQGEEDLESCGPSVFELAGPDGQFAAAEQIVEGRTVRLIASTTGDPTRVRYAWRADTAASLRGASTRLPVAPFALEIP